MGAGIIGAGVGTIIGIIGGAIGTYCSIRNTKSEEERRFMIQASIACWAFIIAFFAALLWLPATYKSFLWIAYAVALPTGIYYTNKRQKRIKHSAGFNDSK